MSGSIFQLIVAFLGFLGRHVNIKISYKISDGKFDYDRELQYAQRAIEKEKGKDFEADRESFASLDVSYIKELTKDHGKKTSEK